MARRQAREVDRREGDAVAGVRLGAVVAAALRRPARAARRACGRAGAGCASPGRTGDCSSEDRPEPPATVPVAARLAVLHLEDQDPALRVGDDEVGLAVLGRPAVAHRPGPGDVRVEAVLGRERLPQPLVDSPLGFLASGHAESVADGQRHGAAMPVDGPPTSLRARARARQHDGAPCQTSCHRPGRGWSRTRQSGTIQRVAARATDRSRARESPGSLTAQQPPAIPHRGNGAPAGNDRKEALP